MGTQLQARCHLFHVWLFDLTRYILGHFILLFHLTPEVDLNLRQCAHEPKETIERRSHEKGGAMTVHRPYNVSPVMTIDHSQDPIPFRQHCPLLYIDGRILAVHNPTPHPARHPRKPLKAIECIRIQG
jgi:hypothetical protein